jgi:hypothetical protein
VNAVASRLTARRRHGPSPTGAAASPYSSRLISFAIPLRLPRIPLLLGWALLSVSAYGLMWFTPWGDFAPSATPAHTIVVETTMVLAGFASWEVLRTERVTALRAVAAAVGFPLVLVMLWTLWYGLRRHLGW